jgi:hypothetical protein
MASPKPAVQKFLIVPPRHGLVWLVNSFALLRLQLARLFFIAVILQFILTLTQVELIGFVVVLAIPGLSAGMLETLARVSVGTRPQTWCLFVPLSSAKHAPRFLALGGIVFVAGALSLMLLLTGNEATLDPQVIERIEQGDATALELLDPALLQQLLTALVVAIAISGTLSYFAIPLLWFRNMSLVMALKTGISALFANWKPFLVLGLCLFGLTVPVVLILGVLVGMGGGSFFAIAMVLLLMLSFQLLMFATQYCSFIDIFPDPSNQAESENNEGEGTPPEGESGSGDSGQFVA